MPKKMFGPFLYGVDYSTPPAQLQDTALADAANVIPLSNSLLTGRGGTGKMHGNKLNYPVKSFHEFLNGDTSLLLANYGNIVGYLDTDTQTMTPLFTLTSAKKAQWVTFGEKAIMINEGSDNPQYITDTSTYGDLAGSPPKGKSIAVWSNRVWLGGDSTDLATLTGCCVSDPTDWTTNSTDAGIVEQIVGDEGDPIIGIRGYFDWLIIGKKNTMYKLYSSTNPTAATKLSIKPIYCKGGDSVGFTSPWAIEQVGNDLLFLDGFDIKRLSGIQEYGDVETASVIPHFREYIESVADKDLLYYSHFYHYKKKQQLWVTIPTSATTHLVFVLDYKFMKDTERYAVYPMSGMNIECFGGRMNGSISDIYAGYYDGYVRQLDMNTNDDSGVAIKRYFTITCAGLERDDDGDVTNPDCYEWRKHFQQMSTCILPTKTTLTMTPSYATDIMDSEEIRDSTNYTDLSAQTVSSWPGTGLKRKDIRLLGVSGKALAVKWTHETLGENFVFYPSSISWDVKERIEIV
jgi:hypothetical protein